MEYIPDFRQTFPELNHISSADMADRFRKLGIDWYSEKRVSAPFWIRLTLPFALIAWIGLLLSLPFGFIFTGSWGYSLGNTGLLNWFRSVGLA